MARFHAIWGVIFAVVFLATGRHMRNVFPDAYLGDPTMRMLFRSAHVYILLAALINGAYAIHLRRLRGWRGIVQVVASVSIAAGPVIFLLAFFVEPAPGRLERPYALMGVISVATGVVLGGIATLLGRQERISDSTSL